MLIIYFSILTSIEKIIICYSTDSSTFYQYTCSFYIFPKSILYIIVTLICCAKAPDEKNNIR